MTEDIEDAQIVSEEQPEQVEQPEQLDAETAFIMIKQLNGTWKATTDLSTTLLVGRTSTRNDIKTGTRDIHTFLSEDDLANTVASKILASTATDTERATQGVRQALADRDIL